MLMDCDVKFTDDKPQPQLVNRVAAAFAFTDPGIYSQDNILGMDEIEPKIKVSYFHMSFLNDYSQSFRATHPA